MGAEILGYISAVLYLGARVPQIAKNQRERSCEGLSLLFFLLSLTGNATYGAAVSRCARCVTLINIRLTKNRSCFIRWNENISSPICPGS